MDGSDSTMDIPVRAMYLFTTIAAITGEWDGTAFHVLQTIMTPPHPPSTPTQTLVRIPLPVHPIRLMSHYELSQIYGPLLLCIHSGQFSTPDYNPKSTDLTPLILKL